MRSLRLAPFVCSMPLVVAAVPPAAPLQEEGTALAAAKADEHHALLAEDVGTWDADCKLYFLGPGSEPMRFAGVETIEMMGDLWMLQHFEGELGGLPFEGRAMVGWDAEKKKYVGVWADTMTSHMAEMEGTYDPATRTMTTWVDGRDPLTGQATREKHVERHVDDDTRLFEMHAPSPMAEGQLVKVMEVTYRRRR